MAKDLCSGLGVWVKMPYGEFVVDGTADAVLIAGGTGITAFQAFIEGLVPDHPRKVVLLYGARRPGLLLGREMLEEKQRKVASFRAFFFSETGVPSSDPAPGTTLPGRTNLNAIEDCTVSDSTVYYLAGPPAMVAAIRVDLEHTGVTGKSIRVDAWE
jgi:ferredoxin-NADP reductase